MAGMGRHASCDLTLEVLVPAVAVYMVLREFRRNVIPDQPIQSKLWSDPSATQKVIMEIAIVMGILVGIFAVGAAAIL